ncbi:nucleoside diphosphate kinase, mitochondrial [Hypomesus transpacificus]|uniref:nucleoside diphosphate kinase, mitochondrial n=1 Tax=Hypomesus transpacificus TaxID=137520 RepID=UPI001F087D7D|nr:nucleoside diphosphate kinase, mitochondrial [Hypomesus transpacificus]
MVLFFRGALKNIFLNGKLSCTVANPSKYGFAPENTFTLLRQRSVAGHNTLSGIPGVTERTLIAVKPDGVQRRLVGHIMHRFEQRGFKLVGLKMLQVPNDLLSQHYKELKRKPFFPGLLQYMTSGPVVVMVWEGHNVVQASRIMVGHTNPAEAQAGTIRGDFSIHISRNIVHASDSVEGAQREIQLWFHGRELLDWDCCDHSITYQL